MSANPFASTTDYDVPLLRLLFRLPSGEGKPVDIRRCFEDEYGDRIPEEHRELYDDGKARWQQALSWAAYRLRKRALFGSEPGTWRITEAGRHWVEENPDATRFLGMPIQRSRRRSSYRQTALPAITLDMLAQTRKVMPSDKFRAVWGDVYDELLAEERAKAITRVSQTELGRRTSRRLDEIHTFLLGENSGSPSAEALCDWIHFCYALELHREAAVLLPYVREDEVEPAIYKRATRVAEVCRSKLAG